MALMRFTIRTDQSASTAQSALTAAALIVAVLAALPSALSARERLPGPVQADVVQVHDGDTLQIRARIWLGQVINTKVRLAGVEGVSIAAQNPNG